MPNHPSVPPAAASGPAVAGAVSAPELSTERPLHRLVEIAAQRTPENTAIVDEDEAIDFARLDQRANQLAQRLSEIDLRPDDRVAILASRSIAFVVAALGTLKAGAAFVPIDPEWPQARQALVMRDADPRAVITAGQQLPEPEAGAGRAWIDLERDRKELAARPSRPVSSDVAPDHLAYIIYTSGSTGAPKGVMIEHRAVATHLASIVQVYALAPGERSLWFHSPAFDPSIEQVFGPLITGGCAIVRGPGLWSGSDFSAEVRRHRIRTATLPAAYWLQILRDWKSHPGHAPVEVLRQVIVGGETLPLAAVQLWRELGLTSIRVINDYGPTECTITATTYALPESPTTLEEFDRRVPIGRPHGPVEAIVLDENMHTVPVGMPGELWLGGPTLARGYLGQEGLTSRKFIAHPWRAGQRLYRTGDRARLLGDGCLDFLGRVDDQVKVRGHRIELGEVESRLAGHAAVAQCAVVVLEKDIGDRWLAAAVVPADPDHFVPDELRADLATQLPPAAVPAVYRCFAALPVTASGKIDRAALVAEFDRAPATVSPPPPEASGSPLLQAIVRVWSEALGASRLGLDDHVFHHGATSLTVTRVHRQLQETLQRRFPITLLFERTTCRALASALSSGSPAGQAENSAVARARRQREALARRPGMAAR